MSGLFAVLNLNDRPVDDAVAQKMLNRLRYRGMDAQTLWHEGALALGHTQAQVTSFDAHDRQPVTRNGVTIVADSGLVARAELVAALNAQRHAVTLATPDSELILAAYQVWGEDCLQHIMGEFAFILWDAHQRKLLAAPDPLRVRELYYAQVGDTVIIANEIAAVLLHPAVSAALNEAMIGDFLLFSTTDRHIKNKTIFADIERVPIGHALIVHERALRLHQYWNFPYDEPMLRYDHPQAYVEHFSALFTQVVKERVENIDSVVVQMSGGMDSTSIAATIAGLIRSGAIQTKLSLISAVYDRIVPDNEAYFANLTAQFLEIPTEFLACDGFYPCDPLPTRMEPMPDFSTGFTRTLDGRLASLGKRSVSGNGGDEVFTNTPLYQVLLLHPLPEAFALYRWLWKMTGRRPGLDGTRAYLQQLLMFGRESVVPSSFPYPVWLQPEFADRLHLKERLQVPWNVSLKKSHPTQPELPIYVGLGAWNMRSEFITPHDHTPVETTLPFIDLRLIRFILSVPPTPWNRRKLMLREAMTGKLPTEVLRRPKTGLSGTGVAFTSQPGGEWLDAWEPVPELTQYVRRDAVPPVYKSGSRERASVDMRPLFLNQWLKALHDWLRTEKPQG